MKIKLFLFTIYLIILVGCVPNLDSKSVQLILTPTLESPTSISTIKLQITYIENKQDQNFGELYTTDITCMTPDKVCLGEPKLLFQSLRLPDRAQIKPWGLLTDYSWSPDGSKIALISGRDILIGSTGSYEWTNITNNPSGIGENTPKWSHDGNFIYSIHYIEDASGMGIPQLVRSDLEWKEKLPLLRYMNKIISNGYDVSPDGRRIIFAISGPLGISDLLYQANSNGTDSHQITTIEDVSEIQPSFSPDGKKFAFVRSTIKYYVDSKEESDIIVKDLTTGEEKNLTSNFDDLAFSPIFSPDANWLAFDATDSEFHWNIFLVSLETGNIIQVTKSTNAAFSAWRTFSE
jgi:Tol biopolymer transport system component